jgi:ABC-type glycerol-3-phosphate transport system substrate-binding protein
MKKTLSPVLLIWMVVLGMVFTSCKNNQTVLETTASPTITKAPIHTITPTPTENVIRGTVMIWHSWEEMQRSALFRRITAFQARYPDVQFDVLYIPAIDLRASFEAAMAENFGPTILIAPAEWGVELYEKDWVSDLNNLAGTDMLATLNKGAVGTGTYKGKLLSLPLHEKGVVLYRNKSLVPNPAINFDSLITLAQTATEGGEVGAMLERSFYYSAGHLYGLGGQFLNDEGLPVFDAENYRYSLTWLNLLRAFENAGVAEYRSDNDMRMFNENRVGFIIESTSQMYNLAGELDPLNLAIDPWPSYQDGKLAGFVQAEGAYLTPKALAQENMISWLFLESLLTSESQASFSGVGYIPSIRPEILESTNQRIGDPFIAQAMAALDQGAPYPSLPVFNLYATQMDVLLQAVLLQGADPLVALQAAYETLKQQVESQPVATPTP